MAKNKRSKEVEVPTMPDRKKDEQQKLQPGVYITRTDGRVMAFTGRHDVQNTPAGDLVIMELVPDVGNKNNGKDLGKIRMFIGAGSWTDVNVIE